MAPADLAECGVYTSHHVRQRDALKAAGCVLCCVGRIRCRALRVCETCSSSPDPSIIIAHSGSDLSPIVFSSVVSHIVL